MAKNDSAKFFHLIKNGKTEEDIKHAYAEYFGIQYNTADKHDLYTAQVFFEFKFHKNFENVKIRAAILAQILYYVRRLKFGGYVDKPIPFNLCFADQNEAALTETKPWKDFYDDAAGKYDWDLAPSSPDTNLIRDLAETDEVKNMHIYKVQNPTEFNVFAEQLTNRLNPQVSLFGDKKQVNENNFEEVFQYWNTTFGEAVRNGLKPSKYFVADIQKGRTLPRPEENKVFFKTDNDNWREKKILAHDYNHFWSLYDRVENPDVVRDILAKIDRLTDETMRRFEGAFFTPVKFAQKALDYLEKTVGKEWWKSGEYRLWDMAAGTGNLEYYLPVDALQYCYLSTLYTEDVEHCQRLFPNAVNFQYDYLNDDVENLFHGATALPFQFSWKLPEKLRADLANPNLKWIILINPPFATSQTAGTNPGSSKEGVSDTKIRGIMHKNNLGEVSRELFTQFLYRISKEFENKTAHLGFFSSLKYLIATNDQKFRDEVFHYAFEDGFIFSSANFSGTSKNNQFSVSVVFWNLRQKKKLEEQEIVLDIFNENVEKIGTKKLVTTHRDNFLSKWIERPPASKKFPPFGSAIETKFDNKDRRDRIANNFLASLMCKGNDLVNQTFTALLSAPYVSAGALSITPENFEQAMIIHAVRRIPKDNWVIHQDQFLQPQGEIVAEFTDDCAVWNLFSNSNQTASLRNVEYEGQIYQIRNHFFPFTVAEVKSWKITDGDIADSLSNAEDTFVALWLKDRNLSKEAEAVLKKGKEIYKFYFANLAQVRTTKFKIESWDAGWWQIRNVLADVH
ncbi:MAG: hypothetical protein M3033_08845, partial [Acidobacteriota bacterium]|nr:hypothetical protein [Acidobacteriota bacterium]